MSGVLETSVIVRYLVNDVPELAGPAARLIDSEVELYVTGVILVEVAHALRTLYRIPRQRVVDDVVGFLRKQNIRTVGMEKNLAIDGLLLCRPSGRVSFPDALIWAEACSSGHQLIYTFDRRFPGVGVTLRHDLP